MTIHYNPSKHKVFFTIITGKEFEDINILYPPCGINIGEVIFLNTAKQILYRLIEEVPDNQLPEIIDFINFLKSKKDKEVFKDLELTSQSSIDFWNNEIDDEVWNNV